MPKLVWDKVGERIYETGLDRGVLYLPDGSAVPWNGLTAVVESFDKESSPVYYDGSKINDLIVLGDFNASMKAVTYPDEFVEIEGMAKRRRGLYYADQPGKTFGLCYRVLVGNDLEGEAVGYKLHILYNVTATPNDKTYASLSDSPSLVEFEWNITAVPEEIEGFRPTAHIVLDSRDLDPWLLEDIEDKLYGSTAAEASLIPMQDLITFIDEWFRVKIVDNGDGTWTATSLRDSFIHFGADGWFEIVGVNAVYLDDDTFVINDTIDIAEVPAIKINDNNNGTWTATTSHDNLIEVVGDGLVEIRNANVEYLNATTYRISDTEED